LCLPIAEALLYLAFKVQFRESSTKVPFQPVTCQHLNFNSRSKTLSCKAYRLSVNDFLNKGHQTLTTQEFEPKKLTRQI
jgi:hypothetical protein